jgi:hypothetical protein
LIDPGILPNSIFYPDNKTKQASVNNLRIPPGENLDIKILRIPAATHAGID